MGLDLITKVTNNDDNVLRLHRCRGRHGVTQHRMTGDLVEQLGTRGLHPLALTGSQDDDGCDRVGSWIGVDGQQLAPY
jgi:hypothetical protein